MVSDLLEAYRLSGLVEIAEVDVRWQLFWPNPPNDPHFQSEEQWGLHNEGTGPLSASGYLIDIDAPEGWQIRNAAPNVVVAVIDTGIRYDHEDLAGNMCSNPGVNYTYNEFTIQNGAWSPYDPEVGYGEAFWSWKTVPEVWGQTAGW